MPSPHTGRMWRIQRKTFRRFWRTPQLITGCSDRRKERWSGHLQTGCSARKAITASFPSPETGSWISGDPADRSQPSHLPWHIRGGAHKRCGASAGEQSSGRRGEYPLCPDRPPGTSECQTFHETGRAGKRRPVLPECMRRDSCISGQQHGSHPSG